MKKLLLVGLLAALSGFGHVPKASAAEGTYFQCVAPGPGIPSGGLCPVSSTNPLPTTSGGGGGGGAVTIADGADVAAGHVADAAWVSGNGTMIALLKAIDNAVNSSIPAGTAVIGHVIVDSGSITITSAAVTGALGSFVSGAFADGAITTIGTEADAAYAGSGSTTVVGALKGIYTAAVQPLAAGTNAIGSVTSVGSQYPTSAVAITASATGTTAATAATLAHVTGHTVYICGFSIRANATAAATGNSTVAGTITGTLNFTQWTAPLASGIGITEMIFNPCVPASAINTDVVITSAAPGSGGVVSTTGWGYSL